MKCLESRNNMITFFGAGDDASQSILNGHHLTQEVANTVACSIVGTRIDYCNSLFYGASEKYLDKLQCLQNKLVRVVTKQVCEITTLLISGASCTGCLFEVGYPLKWQLCVVVR